LTAANTTSSKHHQQQHPNRPALDGEREVAMRVALVPGEHQPRQRRRTDPGQTQFHRHPHPALIAGIFEQRRDSREQHQHPDLDRDVAGQEPVPGAGERAFEGVGRDGWGCAERLTPGNVSWGEWRRGWMRKRCIHTQR